MKAGRWMMTALAMLAGLVWVGTVQAGSLTPPAAPGSTMKTLTEVHDRAHAAQTAAEAAENAAEAAEPRTAISGAVTITQPGSYYLSGNITGQITIQADNVTLDLMGFRIEHPDGSTIVITSGFGANSFIRIFDFCRLLAFCSTVNGRLRYARSWIWLVTCFCASIASAPALRKALSA